MRGAVLITSCACQEAGRHNFMLLSFQVFEISVFTRNETNFWVLTFIQKKALWNFEEFKLDDKDVQENHLLVASRDKIYLSVPNGFEKEAPCASRDVGKEWNWLKSEFAFGSAGCGRKPRNCQQRDTIRTLGQRFCRGMAPLGFLYKCRWSISIPFSGWIPHPRSDLDDRVMSSTKSASENRERCGFLEVGIPKRIFGVWISFLFMKNTVYIYF